MKIISTSLSRIFNNDSLRLDFGMRFVDDCMNFNPFNLKNNFVVLGNVLTELKSPKVKKGDLEHPMRLIDLNNIYKKFNYLQNVELKNTIESDKSVIKNGDIVIAKMTPKLGSIFLNDNHDEFLASTELIEYKIENFDHLFLFYILSCDKILSVLNYMESGKNQRRVQPSDLLKLVIPKPNIDIINKIKKLDKEILDLIKSRKDLNEIIDSAFKKILNINVISSRKLIKTNLRTIGNDSLCRMSFHNQCYFKSFEYKKVKNEQWTPIFKKFVISGGKRIPKGQTFSSKPTSYYYLRPNEISLLYGINKDEIPNISEVLYKKLFNYRINTGEFCISNVGTLGKVCLVDLSKLEISDDCLIMSENFLKLTPTTKINSEFYFYYFNSYLFKKQIEREYTITSVQKLGLDKMRKITIPNFDEKTEKLIMDLIHDDLHKQQQIEKEIIEKRKLIDSEITNSFCYS